MGRQRGSGRAWRCHLLPGHEQCGRSQEAGGRPGQLRVAIAGLSACVLPWQRVVMGEVGRICLHWQYLPDVNIAYVVLDIAAGMPALACIGACLLWWITLQCGTAW